MRAVVLTEINGEPRADSRNLAHGLQTQHESVMKLVNSFAADFRQLGILRFQIGEIQGRGRPEKFALLNEDQCYLLLTFTRNTPHVRAMKVDLVKAFRQARAGRQAAEAEYLPGYHELHDRVQVLAAESSNERFVHMNLNKLVNKTVGIGPGMRRTVASSTKSAIVVAQHVAVQAMEAANDHHDGYAAAKKALGGLQTLLLGKSA